MKNFVQEGKALDFVAPSGGVVSGLGYVVGALFHVASTTAAEGEEYSGWTEGVFELVAETHATTQAISKGDPVYWDATNDRATKTATGNLLIGAAVEDKVSTVAVVKVKLWPRGAEPSASITDPTGGATVDAEARTAIGSIIDALQAAGIVLA